MQQSSLYIQCWPLHSVRISHTGNIVSMANVTENIFSLPQ